MAKWDSENCARRPERRRAFCCAETVGSEGGRHEVGQRDFGKTNLDGKNTMISNRIRRKPKRTLAAAEIAGRAAWRRKDWCPNNRFLVSASRLRCSPIPVHCKSPVFSLLFTGSAGTDDEPAPNALLPSPLLTGCSRRPPEKPMRVAYPSRGSSEEAGTDNRPPSSRRRPWQPRCR
jgi:hypothetical protein